MIYYLYKLKTVLWSLFINLKKSVVISQPLKCHYKGRFHIGKNISKVSIGSLMLEKNTLCTVDSGELTVGNNVFVNRNSIIACKEQITIGDDVIIGPNVCIYDHDHRFSEHGRAKGSDSNPYRMGKIIIGNNVWLGAGVIILRNTRIGDNSIIGAGCIIKGDIPDNSIVKNTVCLDVQPLVKK